MAVKVSSAVNGRYAQAFDRKSARRRKSTSRQAEVDAEGELLDAAIMAGRNYDGRMAMQMGALRCGRLKRTGPGEAIVINRASLIAYPQPSDLCDGTNFATRSPVARQSPASD